MPHAINGLPKDRIVGELRRHSPTNSRNKGSPVEQPSVATSLAVFSVKGENNDCIDPRHMLRGSRYSSVRCGGMTSYFRKFCHAKAGRRRRVRSLVSPYSPTRRLLASLPRAARLEPTRFRYLPTLSDHISQLSAHRPCVLLRLGALF